MRPRLPPRKECDRTNMFERSLNERERRMEWPLMAAVLGLMALGLTAIYSSSTAINPNSNFHWKQAIFYVLGLGLAAGICLLDYKILARWALIGYWLAIVLLVVVVVFGTKKLGAKRWIDVGSFQFQPSEFAKLAFIFFQAHFLSRPADELRLPAIFFQSLLLAIVPFCLILIEPDLGSALVFLPITLAMMFVVGVPSRYLRRFIVGVAILAALVMVDILFAPPKWRIKLKEYQRDRLLVYFGKEFAPANATPEERKRLRQLQRDKSHNVEQAMISVGSGGLWGKGWRQGSQYALGYLPDKVAHNDFIFSVIAEEKGFMGSVMVLSLYTVVLFSGIKIAGQARDRLGKLLAVGIITLLFTHVFINIGMNIRIMPVTGIPLPLLSYGGSSVLCSLIALGILQNVNLYKRSY